ncbi:hypothetical protein PHLGIDRAFT_422003 [Phlebiopsis gigantea 11061_1 CR5-6]|uniref:Fungal-type protein kinase domain-containing protein n=1 Tax=Phlebiopsis gigantea (strain 11061_1 CR5-6) TaxID=745531 RepID=A0A0C3SAV5_PHLG1|nr:hypothetical protein PHLGIDRAFT_422003 [Phlebiopsis gigantea 11061_1 CR5-6]
MANGGLNFPHLSSLPSSSPAVPTRSLLTVPHTMSYGWHDIGGWRWNDGWDPATAKDDASLLKDRGYDTYASKRDSWTYWRGSKREESDWDRRVAGISANDFLAAFLPVSPIPPTHLKRLQASSHFSRPKMKNAYSACCRALEATLKLAKSADVVKDISPEPMPEKVYRRFPDLALYPDSKIAHDAYDLPADVRMLDVPKDRARYRAHASWAHMVMPIEVCSDWGFYEAENRARMYHYAARVFSHQHRQHVFSLHLHGYQALIARWDRSGVVTSKFNLKTDSSVFYDFIHRFGRLTRAQQGYDPTVEFASPKDVAKLLQYTTTNEYLKLYHKNMSSDLEVWPIYKVSCDPLPDAGETDASRPSPSLRPRPKVFLIGKPLNYTERQEASPLGKSVRAYIAYDLADDRLVFLKDSWRDKEPFEDSEFGAYLKLRQHKIPHVPTPLAGGDVPNEPGSLIQSTQPDALIQYTRSGAYTSRKSRLLHHRLVLKEVCRPLWTYTCTPELIIAVYHALLAHRGCFETAGVLHRDISHNNIMIDVASNEPRGMLVDFDIHIAREDMDEDWAHYLTVSASAPRLYIMLMNKSARAHSPSTLSLRWRTTFPTRVARGPRQRPTTASRSSTSSSGWRCVTRSTASPCATKPPRTATTRSSPLATGETRSWACTSRGSSAEASGKTSKRNGTGSSRAGRRSECGRGPTASPSRSRCCCASCT